MGILRFCSSNRGSIRSAPVRWAICLACLLMAAWMGLAWAAPPGPAPSGGPDAKGIQFFETNIRPLLAQRCYACHSSRAKIVQGGLVLDSRPGWQRGGASGPAVVPGHPEKSLLIKAVLHKPGAPQMPPQGKLSERELAVLVDWVKMGAPDPRDGDGPPAARKSVPVEEGRKRWAFQPLAPGTPPPVRAQAWCRTPVDRFILAKLEQKGLKPNPYADRRTLIRRAYFDLIGLPPTPEEVDQFLNDRSPDAWEKVVDRLLASPHYGERWGRHWLDLARFAESHGFEHDYDRPTAYPYRDFVIKALNMDMPYDQFVRWQLAGDEIAPEDPLALAATGFLAAGVHSTQITKNLVEKERYDELDDMLATTGTAMLGMTLGCARCHDHKFDPIPQKDYYRLLSTFTTTVRSEMDINLDLQGYREATTAFEKRHAPLVEALRKFESEQLPGRMAEWLKARAAPPGPPNPGGGMGPSGSQAPPVSPPTLGGIQGGPGPARWRILEIGSSKSKGGATFTDLGDGSLLAGGKNPDLDTYTLTARTHLTGITAIRLEALAHPSLVKGGPGRAANGNIALTDFRVTAAPMNGQGQAVEVKLAEPAATFEQAGLPVRAAIDADAKSAWAVDPQFGKDHAALFHTEAPVGFEGGTVLTFTLKFENNTGHNIGRPRLSVTAASRPVGLDGIARPERVERILGGLAPGSAALLDQEREVLLKWYRTVDPGWRKLNEQVQAHLTLAPKPKTQKMLISSEGVPAVRLHTQGEDFLNQTHFLKRGDPNQKLEVASQGFLQVLMRSPEGEKQWQVEPPQGWRTSYRRRALANWITDPKEGAGHLLARVIVNRLWQHHMGRGIVGTPSDFGTQGEKPTHPELLDWLAIELMNGGKGESENGRVGERANGGQGSQITHSPTLPLSHSASKGAPWSIKRLHRLIMTSAVYLQSSAIDAVKAKADPENRLCGRYPRRRLEAEVIRDSMLAVSGLLDRTQFGPGTLDESHQRRSIYFTVKRSKLIPILQVFDAPDALQGIAVRPRTTVAPQALLLLNNPNVLEYARSFAKRAAPTPETPRDEAVRAAYLIALSRPPTARELADALVFLEAQKGSYQAAGQANPEETALADFCQVLMGLNEFIYVE
jgi:uncharacterized protein DUF1549/uncharacterized protein DUF1553/cytochrome c